MNSGLIWKEELIMETAPNCTNPYYGKSMKIIRIQFVMNMLLVSSPTVKLGESATEAAKRGFSNKKRLRLITITGN